MKNLILITSFLIFSFHTFAQEQQSKFIRISDFYLQGGTFGERGRFKTLEETQRALPESDLLRQDYDGYQRTPEFYYLNTGTLSLLVGFQFAKSNGEGYRSNPRLRLGLIYLSGTALHSSYRRQDRYHVDNLTSENTGQVYPVDSVSQRTLQTRLLSEQIHLEGSLIFSTNPEKRFTLFSGLGITGGASFQSNAEVRHTQQSYTTHPPENDRMHISPFYEGEEYQQEDIRTGTLFGASAYVPLGVNFRFGTTDDFWKLLNLYYEARPSLQFTSIPNLSMQTTAVIHHNIGLRVSW
ncbi:hypothetical protein RCC89_14380 [Cytophagaceae bacterium ABcell3]|nr:hypothetical protein RCC89_14380 [Cytophagaceae bacterium ABcell3]